MKILFVLLAAVGGAFLAAALSFFAWRAGRAAALRTGSAVVATARGPVEVARRGSGPPVLVLHGLTGGYDQGLVFAGGLVRAGYEAISVSRPGYLRTPLATGATAAEQADACAVLLDALHLDRAAVVGISAGGLPAISLALRHPERVRALILLSGVTGTLPGAPDPRAGRRLARFTGALAAAAGDVVVRLFPERTARFLFDIANLGGPEARRDFAASVVADPGQRAWMRALVNCVYPAAERRAGIDNDLVQLFGTGAVPLERIAAPTLIVHGDADRIVPFWGAQAAARRIPGAVLAAIPGGGHLVRLGLAGAEADRRMAAFLAAHP